MKVFVDTNVLIDFVCQRNGFARDALILFDLAYKGKITVSISALSFINAYYVGMKYNVPSNMLQSSLKAIMTVVEVAGLDKSILEKAFEMSVKDFEDAAQYLTAERCGSECIVTRNQKDFEYSRIPVLSPHELLGLVL